VVRVSRLPGTLVVPEVIVSGPSNLFVSLILIFAEWGFFSQQEHFGGWPNDLSEFPVIHMTQEHKKALILKCSKNQTVDMPDFPESPTKERIDTKIAFSNTVTPPPNSGALALHQKKAEANGGMWTITPCHSSATPITNETIAPQKTEKINKHAVELHRKWQAAAEAASGPGARIILSKPAAKQIIYELLHDRFGPMTITEIHTVCLFFCFVC
jgi:hypothetical protein